MVDEFELALKQLNTQPKDEFEIALEELSLSGLKPQARGEAEQLNRLREVPEMINRTGGLPIGGEPMVGGPDILAQEQGQTKTFMAGEPVKVESESGRGKISSFVEGKPVEVRRAQAIDIGGRTIEEPISPDGMGLDFRGNLIKEKTKELQSASGLPYSEYIQKSNTLRSELSKLQETQQKHEVNQLGFLSKLITQKPNVSVDLETRLGEERVTGAEGKTTNVPIQTRTTAAINQIGDQREFIDNIIVNDKFLDYAKTKGIDAPGLVSRMAGQYLNVGESPDKLEELKRNPEVRKLAEEWAMTSPEFMDVTKDIFKRAWDGYAGAIGSGTVGPIGLLLKGAGLEQTGQSFIDAADYADQQRLQGQDPRRVGALAQFGRDVSSGLGFTGAAIVTGALGNTARASLGLNSERAINLFQKANTLTFGGLNSAWAGYSEAKSDGATDEQAKQAALFTALTQAPLELVSPLQKWVSRFDATQQKRLYKGLNKAAQAVVEGTEEALFNEMPQQIAGNLVKKFVYDPNQDIFEGVQYAGGVGGASGILSSIFTQMISGKKAKKQAQQGDQEGSEQTDIESKADEMAAGLDTDPAQELAQQMMSASTDINNLKEEIANDEMGLQAIEKAAPEYQAIELALNEKKANLAALQTQFDKLSAGPAETKTETPAAATATPTATKETTIAKIDELNKEFDALDENDQVGIDRLNKQIFAEQNKLARLTAIEQGIDPQGTTPTREMGLPPSGRRSEFGTFFPDRPVLQAFVKATDKVLGGITVTNKRAQKLKNAIRTGIANNAGFLAGTNTEVISSEEYGKLTGGKQVAADTGTYRATFFNGKKYLVVPDINQLAGISIQGEQRAASRDAALDQESRAAAKKLEEEMIHLSMFQGIQDEYKNIKKPNFSEQEYIVKRISDIAKEVKRTNPNALPGVSEVYVNQKNRLLDDMTFSQEFMRMVIQRVRTGQITEDLNAIRKAEQEAFSDQDKGLITAWKNSILNALQFLRNGIARYLGKGTSTKEVKRMEDSINNILDEYGIVKGEANYEFKDYSAAEPKGELKAEPTEEVAAVTPTKEVRNIEEASQETGVSKEAILTAAQNGEIEAAKVGNNWRFGQKGIDEIKSKLSETITTTEEAALEEEAGESAGGIEARAGRPRKALKEGVEVQLEGGNMERMMEILSASQYAKNIAGTIGKESFQNSVDAVMKLPAGTPKVIVYGNKNIAGNEQFRIADNGVGMIPEVMINVFLRAAVSGKGVGEGGGFGLAKLAFLGSPKSFHIISIGTDENGQKFKSTLKGTGKAFYRFNSRPPKVVFKPNTLINLTPNFEDSLTIEYTQVPDDAKTGTASSYTLEENSWQGDYAVIKGLEFVQGITSMGAQNYSETKYDETLGGMAQITKELGFFPNWDDVNEGKKSQEFTSLHRISTPYAEIDIVAPKDSKISKIDYINVPVLNRSIYQFSTDIRLQEQVALPEGISVNIKPKVPAESPNYPFTPNREAVKEDIKDQIGIYFSEAGTKELQKLNDKYRNSLNAAVKIKDGDGGVILDAGSTVPQGTLEMLANNESVKRAYDDVKKIQNAILKILTKRIGRAFDSGRNLYGRAKFAGLLIGARAYGVHFGKNANTVNSYLFTDPNDPNFQSFIYHDIWKEMDLAYNEFNEYLRGPQKDIYENMSVEEQMSEIYDIFLRKVAGVSFHEALHQQVSSEGESLARELTFKTGDIIDAVVDLLESDLNTNEKIQTINDIIRQKQELDTTNNEEAASEFVLSQGGYDGYALAERGRETEGQAESAGDRGAGRRQAPEAPIVARASYYQNFEVFDKNGENRREEQIVVEADTPAQAEQLIRNTPKYQGLAQRDKAKKIRLFSMGQVERYRLPGEFPIIARAGVTPEGEPMSKRGQSIMQKITTRMISDLEAQAEMLKPKKNKAYTEYKSRTTKKGKTYNQALISPFSLAANLFTSNSFTEANNALNKIVRGNPDADFFDIAQGLAGTDAAEAQRRYGIDQNERFVLMDMIYSLLPAFRKEVDDSGMKATARDSFRLDALNVEAKLAQNIALAAQSGGQIVGYARVLRKLVGAGMAILTYKRGIIDSMGSLAKATNASFNDVANAIRGDRRKSMDKVFNTKEVFKKAVSMIKMAQRNPEKVRQAIRAEVSKKQNLKTTDILLQFASGLFDTKEDKYANMVLDQTVQNILSIGMNKKEFSIDNVTKFMYQSFATAAKQLGIEQAGVEKPKRGKRSGKYMEMVKAVIGNDNAYKSFVNDLASRMAEKYQSRDAFNADFAELFTALRSNEWADGLREQAIKDTAQFLNYKFADLFTYLGSQRNVNQEVVKQHIRAELQGTGASNELIEKFIQDTDKYLNEETSRILQDKLGFRIDEKTGKVIPKPLLSSKIKEEAEEQFKAIKNLKDISKLSTSDEGNFIEALIGRIIIEVGMDKEQATELATLISTQMERAMLSQRSENVDRAIKDAQEILNSNGVKPKTNQRTVLQKLIEMANMGVLDAEGVYEAFRKTHDFPKGFLPYDADFTNTLREWGDRISKLPPGVIRSIEEEKMGRALMEKSKFTIGDILSSYWYFSLLSQVATQGINALSGASNLMANVAVWSLYNPKSFFPMMRAMYHAIEGRNSPAVNSFLYVMRNGLNPSGMQDEKRAKYPKTNVLESATPENTPKIVYYLTNFGDGKINFLPDWMNTALKNVNPRQLMRVLRATDMFLREVAYEAKAAQIGAADFSREGFDMAKRQAESELFSSDATGKQKEQEIIIRANEIYREQRLDETGRAIAEQASLETAFNQQPVGLFGLLANFVNSLLGKYPATKFIIPFTNVVANVTNEFINYTPFFSQIRLIGSKRQGVNDPFTQGSAEKQMEMQIKGFIGLAAMAVPFIIQALTGGDEEDQEERPYIQFYAEGPKDPRQKKIWQQRGGQKYSVRVGNTYFSYLPTPLVIPLAMGAMLQEEIKSMNKKGKKVQSEDIGKLAASVLTAPFSVGFVAVLNQSFLTGLADLLEFKESQNPVEKGTQVVGGILSRMAVPGVFRDINKLYTEDKAIGGDYLSNFLKDFPGSVNFLNKDVNYFGDDAKFPSAVREEGFGKRLASVVGRIVSTEQPDPAFEVMYRNNLTPPSWDASLSWDNGKRMTKEQELQFIREAGPLMRERIVEVSDELDELPIDEAQDLLSTEIRIIRREVKEDLQDRLEIPLDIE
jgi:hypothetical protein